MTEIADTGVAQVDASFYRALLDAGVKDADARELARTDAFGGSDPELWIAAVRDGQLPGAPEGEIGAELAAALENARQDLNPDVSPLTIACELIVRGWSPIPIPRQKKAPVIKGWQALRIDAVTVPQYFNGHAQNIGVLLGAPSGGLVDVDLDSPETVRLAAAFLPPTDAVFGRPGKRRSHWLYRADPLVDTTKFTDVEEGAGGAKKTNMLVELRATGAQTVFPGSAHEGTGELIAWERAGDPATVDGHQLRTDVGRLASAALLAKHWPASGSRQEAAMALAAVLLRGGWAEADVEAFLRAVAQVAGDEEAERRAEAVEFTAKRVSKDQATTGWKRLAELVGTRVADRVKDWLQLREVDPVLAGGPSATPIGMPSADESTSEPPAPDPLGAKLHCTDLGNAERLVRFHGRDLRYCHDWSKWLVWDGKRWAKDETGGAMRRAIGTVRTIFHEVARADDDNERKRLSRHAFESESAGKLHALLDVAQSNEATAVTSAMLDADIWLLNCANGVLDLRTGQLRLHSRADLITKLAPVTYAADAPCPTWERFLERILPDQDVRDFVQRAAGYSLTGSVGERTLLVLWGTGRNGKSTLMETLHAVWGDYALMTPPETFLTRSKDAIPNDLARLKGARLVSANETEEEKRLAEAAVKQMVGGDTITARFMRAEFFEFKPQFTPWLRTNHRPQVRGTDKAIWDRIKLVPFTVRIEDDEVDQDLPGKLLDELPGILAWAVRGCLLWQTIGLAAPAVVGAATDEYRVDMDLLGAFLDEYCVNGPGLTVSVKRLYGEYAQWAKTATEPVLPLRRFNAALKERGFASVRTRNGYEWQDLGLTPSVINATPSP